MAANNTALFFSHSTHELRDSSLAHKLAAGLQAMYHRHAAVRSGVAAAHVFPAGHNLIKSRFRLMHIVNALSVSAPDRNLVNDSQLRNAMGSLTGVPVFLRYTSKMAC